ncbi:hypothetical protein ACRW11_08035, partial [Escherichia coli]
QKQKKLIMLPSETMIWQPEFTDKTLSRKPGAVHPVLLYRKRLWRGRTLEVTKRQELVFSFVSLDVSNGW